MGIGTPVVRHVTAKSDPPGVGYVGLKSPEDNPAAAAR